MRDDLKTAWRSLTSGGAVTIAALAVLTLGIGATTANGPPNSERSRRWRRSRAGG
jgi:hypothetical protein